MSLYKGNILTFLAELNKFLKENNYGTLGGPYDNMYREDEVPDDQIGYVAYFPKGSSMCNRTRTIFDTEDLEKQVLDYLKEQLETYKNEQKITT